MVGNRRDVQLSLIGHDRTGRATRSAGNNLDQLKRKLDKFNISSKSAGRAGSRAGAAFTAGFIKTITFGQVGQGFAKSAVKLAPAAAKMGGSLGTIAAAAMVGHMTTALMAAMPLALGGGILGLPSGWLIAQEAKAKKDLKSLRKRRQTMLDTIANPHTTARSKKIAKWTIENRLDPQIKQLEKASLNLDRLKKKAVSFMNEIAKPVRLPLKQALVEVGDGLDKLKKPFKDLVTYLAPALVPFTRGVMKGLLNFVTELGKAMPGVKAGLKEWGKEMPKIGGAVGKFFGDLLSDPEKVKADVKAFGKLVKDTLITVRDILNGINAAVDAYRNLSAKIDKFEKATGEGSGGPLKGMANAVDRLNIRIENKIKELRGRFLGWIKRMWREAGASFKENHSKVLDDVKRWVGNVIGWFRKLPGRVKSAISGVANRVKTEFTQAKDAAVAKAKALVNGFIDKVKTLPGKAKAQAGRVKGAILDKFSGARGWLINKGRDVINGLLAGLKEPWQKVKDWVGGIAKWIKEHKGPISLDRRLLIPAGKALMGGLLEGLKFGFGSVGDFVYKAGSKVSDVVSGIGGPTGPPGVGSRKLVGWHGGTFTERFRNTLIRAQKLAGAYMPVMQGGWRPRTSYSGTSHAGDAIDTRRSVALLSGLRRAGVAAWMRGPAQGMVNHIHGVPLPGYGYPQGSGIWQAQDFLRGGIGLSADSSWGSMGLLRGGVYGSRRNPDQVRVEAPNVSVRNYLDGKEIKSVVRETVIDDNKRAAWNARTGRR